MVLIEMEKPKCCYECGFCSENAKRFVEIRDDNDEPYTACFAKKGKDVGDFASEYGVIDGIDFEKKCMPWCPITEIPPHGRLIDADVIMDNLEGLDIAGRITVAFARFVVKDAPTVIERSE